MSLQSNASCIEVTEKLYESEIEHDFSFEAQLIHLFVCTEGAS